MNKTKEVLYQTAAIRRRPTAAPPAKRIPRGWSAVPIRTAEDPLELQWTSLHVPSERSKASQPEWSSRFRITIAVEIREEIRVEAYSLVTGTILGTFDIRYAYVFQPFEIILNEEQTRIVQQEGAGLRIVSETENPLWIFDDLSGDKDKAFFTPHMMQIANHNRRMDLFLDRMLSLSSLQPFGWLEGCVLDGLYSLRDIVGKEQADKVIRMHLEQFILPNGQLHYEDLHGRPADGRFSGNESTLPMAVLAKLEPNHPLIDQVVSYWPSILNHDVITAESAYTVACPMAVIASNQCNESLARTAVRQILIRRDHLIDGGDLYGIVRAKEEQRTMRNWARSYTWYMLGMIRTWIELKRTEHFRRIPEMKEIEAAFKQIADIALARREPNGLWSCFLGEPETKIETSGSAGIAAALALGAKHGLLSQSAFTAAEEALHALQDYLTPDGILSGVCQHNCGGLQLQRGGYRTMSQMGMGLMAQLYAAVHAADENEQ